MLPDRVGDHGVALREGDDAGAVTGVLPLVDVRSVIFGRFLVSMPFVNYGGPLGSDDAVRALGAAAVAEAERRGVKLLELRSRVPRTLDLPVSHRKITVVLDLPRRGVDAGQLAAEPAVAAALRDVLAALVEAVPSRTALEVPPGT